MYLKNDNIIVGLLKNLVKKKTFNHLEGFKVIEKHFLLLELDVSGFDEELITKGLEELTFNTKWYEINNALVLSSEINNPSYNLVDKRVQFLILKENLVKFRDLTLQEK